MASLSEQQTDPSTIAAQLPLFVYGTLRHGQENYWLLRGHTLAEVPATIDKMALYSLRAYPTLVAGEGIVHGDLMTLHPRVYSRLLNDLDQLEGYRPGQESRFRRLEWCIRTETGHEVLAWLYLGDRAILDNEPNVFIPHGDWCRYRRDLIRSTRFGRFELSGDSDTKKERG